MTAVRELRNAFRRVQVKTKEKKSLGRNRRKWKNNIAVNLIIV
jgi:hypothetical protein